LSTQNFGLKMSASALIGKMRRNLFWLSTDIPKFALNWIILNFYFIIQGPMLWFKKVSPKKISWKVCDLDSNYSYLCWEILFFRRKLAQIAENCDHNIDPLLDLSVGSTVPPVCQRRPKQKQWKQPDLQYGIRYQQCSSVGPIL
jgi:hypothetical protein